MLALNLDRAKGNGQFTRQVQAERDPRLDNVIFSHSLLFHALVRSRFECNVRCLNHEGCVAFSFVPPSTCRGHSSAPLPCHSGSPSAGAETWLYTGRPGRRQREPHLPPLKLQLLLRWALFSLLAVKLEGQADHPPTD
ncbi:hypothetical protein BaRGS_00017410 [Batillaria attramentaria]|uniref:Apple domain-containing protein n=1 Tax=Batillaria attramentaria TaxID=370345 RepID=A0ABD0KVQ8_9CAEN